MTGLDSTIISKAITDVIRQVIGKLKNRVLDDEQSGIDILEVGNELCKGRMIPMSPQLIAQVKSIYTKCKLELSNITPVMLASAQGFEDMVWGFIQCSEQTTSNLHTQDCGGARSFIWLRSRFGESALDIAIRNNEVEVAKLLLSEALREDLDSAWEVNGKLLFPLLHDHPKHDGFIFDKLEEEKTREEQGLPPITIGKASVLLFHTQMKMRAIDKRRKYYEKFNLDLLRLNPNKNTGLHIVSMFGDLDYVKKLLEKSHFLLSSRNSEGETPVYIAAREGHVDVLQIMFDCLKGNNVNIEWLLIRSKDKHNALHFAIQNHHAPVVYLLLKEIPQLANHENVFKESPLYLAAERSYFEIVNLILKKCRDKSYTGPNGKTALHAAAISNSAVMCPCDAAVLWWHRHGGGGGGNNGVVINVKVIDLNALEECVRFLLKGMPHLVNEKDENDWMPWRYAVHYNSSLSLKELVKADHSIGFQLVTLDNRVMTSALHIAASRGHCETMKVLMSICLGSPEFDTDRRNILHVAIESKQIEVIDVIFHDESLTSLINQQDNNGNTPAHLLAEWNFEMMHKVIDSRVNIHVLNNDNRTPLDMIDSDEKREKLIKAIAMGSNMSKKISSSSSKTYMNDLYEKEVESKKKKAEARFKMVDNMVLVVTLIATATFAAAFTVPGGYNSDNGSKQGTPYLLRKAAFQAFVISNAIAFSCSCSVLLAHIVILIYRNRYDEALETERKYMDGRIVIMYFLTGVALLAMLIAMVTGFYVVLLPSLWLAILVCVLSICIVPISLIV